MPTKENTPQSEKDFNVWAHYFDPFFVEKDRQALEAMQRCGFPKGLEPRPQREITKIDISLVKGRI